jgi:hypothetical protein
MRQQQQVSTISVRYNNMSSIERPAMLWSSMKQLAEIALKNHSVENNFVNSQHIQHVTNMHKQAISDLAVQNLQATTYRQ